ncbi:MAG: agmatine deiminase family protein [Fibromonadaceae bacterium]|jgi:agmatine deiminase|nr:agmatine deiminase family protein [Fibromonadaceae bacterium]
MQNNIRYPAEWEEQAATWLAMPVNDQNWAARRERIDAFYSKLIDTISRFQPVKILDNLQIPHNDIWIRDFGPFFVQRGKTLEAVSYEFNAWGEKFPPWDLDNAVPEKLANLLNIPLKKYTWILEGGAMEFNGSGLCLTTAPCLFGKKRNSKKQSETLLKDLQNSLGIKSLKILPRGLDGDHTDGHIDNFARFIAKNRIVMAEGFEQEKNEIEAWLCQHCENSKVDVLPLPPQKQMGKETLPASYMNFIFTNGGLIMPTYNCEADSFALEYFKKNFPDREVIGMDCTVVIEEGGSLHCLSKQMP